MKVLFATSEAYPLIKTGGLGDVAHSLPNALHLLDNDVRLVIPAYREVLQNITNLKVLGWLNPTQEDVRVFEGTHPDFEMPIWLVDIPYQFDRVGNPYTHPDGYEWPDNPQRFTLFCRVVALLAVDALDLGWRADVVHANDWQTALIPAFLSQESKPPRRIFTIHNIAYDCQFDYGTFQFLKLPAHWWSMEHAEFYGRFSMLKAGLVFSDAINTVSSRYAEEICTPEYGYGYADILRDHKDKLSGIINGIDTDTWDPLTDPYLEKQYHISGKIRSSKRENREALLKALHAPEDAITHKAPLLGFVGRLVYQKGVDLILESIPAILEKHDAQFVFVGTGESDLCLRLESLTKKYPDKVFTYLGYSEKLAHLVEAGSDMFIMPSRYEPCGLNQLYSLAYGTPPIVRNTGGLADSVTDTNEQTLASGKATGFIFNEISSEELTQAIERAITFYNDKSQWMKIIKNGMNQDNSWVKSANRYIALYKSL
jgi:starch synthase